MRIEAYNQISQVYNTSRASRTKGSGSAGKKDEVQISRAGRDYQVAKQAVAEAPDIRNEKVAALKNSIASGNYKVETGDFAAKLMEKYEAYF
ncbi:MAG: flagellar biosynthesis anti-sigma factor FlgM [Lachnospiraceae bacterium]|nr:flagellar biosynthesis anti-sigma factor FlgM [Lachnospiraceae bacterium]